MSNDDDDSLSKSRDSNSIYSQQLKNQSTNSARTGSDQQSPRYNPYKSMSVLNRQAKSSSLKPGAELDIMALSGKQPFNEYYTPRESTKAKKTEEFVRIDTTTGSEKKSYS